MTTIFVAATALTAAVLVTSAGGNSMTKPAFAQPTTETPSPQTGPGDGTTTEGGGGDFAEFMQCLNAAGPSPTEEQVTSCYDPIYGSGAGDEEAADEGGGDEDTAGGGGGDEDTAG